MRYALLALLAACSAEPRGIVLWHAYTGAEREVLEASAARWNAAHADQPLELVAVPYGAFADKLTSAIPGGNGPDVFIYTQDRIAGWADDGIIEPIEFWVDDARADRYSPTSMQAMSYKGSLWGVPLTVKSMVLYYRTDLVATPPATTDELVALAPKMRARDGYALAYINVDFYGHAPWLFGFGGQLLDGDKLTIATPAGAQAMQFARGLVEKEVVPAHAEGPFVATLFNEGKAATVMSGPWFQADIAAGVPWKVAPLPVISASGKPATPFVGAEGILMSARAHDKPTAFAVMDALADDVTAIDRARRGHQVVPNVKAYDDPAIASDATLQAFRAQLDHTVPMPNDTRMRMVWIPYKDALGEVLAGRAEPTARLIATEKQVTGYLAGQQP